jgi:hypothetical protein
MTASAIPTDDMTLRALISTSPRDPTTGGPPGFPQTRRSSHRFLFFFQSPRM